MRTLRYSILEFQQRLSLVTSLKREQEDMNAEVIHPKHEGLDSKRGWTCMNNVLVCAKGRFQIGIFSGHPASV